MFHLAIPYIVPHHIAFCERHVALPIFRQFHACLFELLSRYLQPYSGHCDSLKNPVHWCYVFTPMIVVVVVVVVNHCFTSLFGTNGLISDIVIR